MSDLTSFEQRLSERLQADAVRRARPFDPMAIAATAREGAFARRWALPVSMRLLFAVAVTALLLVLLLAAAIVIAPRPRPLSSSSIALIADGDIYTVALADGAPRLLATGKEDFDVVQYSPDGESLLARDVTGGIWTVPARGGDPRHVADGALPTWSPTGRQLAFVHEGRLTLLDVTSGDSKTLAMPQGTGPFSALRWARDASALFVVTCGDCAQPANSTDVVLRVPIHGSAVSTIEEGSYSGGGASVSHDGNWLATTQCPPNRPPDCDLLLVDTASGTSRDLDPTDRFPFDPIAWAPDDTWLVYTASDTSSADETTLVRVDLATGRQTVLAEISNGSLGVGSGPGYPAISADGAWVLYSIYSDVPTELRLVRSDGTGDKSLVRLTWPGGTPTSLGQTSWEATNVWPVDDRLPAKPEPAQSCSFERTPADGYYSYVDITGNSGCLRVFPNVRLELDQPANGRDLSFGSDGSLRRLTQAHMTVVDAASAEACPAEFSSAGSWPDLIRLEGLGTNRLCVITNGGGVVELRFDPYYPAEGPLVIHYRTVGAPAR